MRLAIAQVCRMGRQEEEMQLRLARVAFFKALNASNPEEAVSRMNFYHSYLRGAQRAASRAAGKAERQASADNFLAGTPAGALRAWEASSNSVSPAPS